MVDHRPLYHFRPPANWINDPNGLIQWQGQYHLFYQYNPNGPSHGTIHWGHSVSTDLVHWTILPIALTPTPDGPDADGCWSGCAVDNHGVPTLVYTGIRSGDGRRYKETTCLAMSDDGLQTWTKYAGNPVMPAPPEGLEVLGFRDPCVWREGDDWYAVIGSGIRSEGGVALLYRSPDLVQWQYLHPLCTRAQTAVTPIWTGPMWECPQFFPLDGAHVLIVSVCDEGQPNYPAYFVGSYANHTYAPLLAHRLDLGPEYYAPATLQDTTGRRLIWGWLWEARSAAAQRAAGWAGVMSLPRLLTLRPDNTLGIAPVPELQILRGAHDRRTDLTITPGVHDVLSDIQGDALEIVVVVDLAASDASAFGLLLRCSPGKEEYTRVVYERSSWRLLVDREHASLDPEAWGGAHGGTCPETSDELLRLHIFLDRSVVEVYIDGQSCLTARIYPTRPDSLGIDLFAERGSVRVSAIDIWRLAPSPVREAS